MKKATTDERTKRTEADDVEPVRTDEDSRRWKQAEVTANERNPETTKLYINTAARDANKLTQQQSTKLRKLRNKLN